MDVHGASRTTEIHRRKRRDGSSGLGVRLRLRRLVAEEGVGEGFEESGLRLIVVGGWIGRLGDRSKRRRGR